MTRTQFLELIRPERGRVIASVILAVVQGAMLYPTLWLVRELFDKVIPLGQVGWALLACVGILVFRLGGAEIGLLQRTLAMRAAKGAAAERRRGLVQWLLGSDVGALESEDPGRIQARLVNETERLDIMLNRGLSLAVPAAIGTLLAAAAMLVLDWRLALLAIVLGVPAAWLAGRGGGITTAATRRFQAAYERYTSSVRFAVRHLLLIRSRGHVAEEQANQDATIDTLRDEGTTMAITYAKAGRRQTISASVVAVAVLAYGSWLVIHGELTVGGLAAFYVAAMICAGAVGQIGSSIPEIRGGLVAGERIHELAGTTRQTAEPGTATPTAILPLRLESVEFSYGARPVLRGVDLQLDAGQHVDLDGPNGAGKSTLVRLVLGLDHATAGTISFAGVPIAELDGELLRRRIGYAPQKPTFFSGSVLDNLLYGRPGATAAEAERAVELVGGADAIRLLEEGYDSPLGEDGVRLSGGEGQRLAIARALIGQPDLVILDEPGNHLPQAAVAEIVARIRDARPSVALLTIGHGHLAPGVADRSLRLTDGRLVEEAAR